jgi:ribosome maturation factor RimP
VHARAVYVSLRLNIGRDVGKYPTFFCPYRNLRFKMKDALEPLVMEELALLGYDLVEFRRGGSKNRPLLDVRIDRQDQQKVTIDDCTRASRAIEARLDEAGPLVPIRYVLEVSSPGIERRLARAADWHRFAGKRANVKCAALGGRAEVEVLGIDGPEGSEMVTVRDAAGVERR